MELLAKNVILTNSEQSCTIAVMHAGVAELADAYDSGSYGSIPVRVQVPPPAPKTLVGGFFFFVRAFQRLAKGFTHSNHRVGCSSCGICPHSEITFNTAPGIISAVLFDWDNGTI